MTKDKLIEAIGKVNKVVDIKRDDYHSPDGLPRTQIVVTFKHDDLGVMQISARLLTFGEDAYILLENDDTVRLWKELRDSIPQKRIVI